MGYPHPERRLDLALVKHRIGRALDFRRIFRRVAGFDRALRVACLGGNGVGEVVPRADPLVRKVVDTFAAGIGPEALAAALTALGTTVGGPAGTIAGILVSAVGTLYLANLALQITRAIATGKGICLTIAIPPGVSVQ